MKKVLTQEEIDNLIRAARAGPGATAPVVEPPAVTAWDGRQAGQIGQEHMQAINRLHQSFAHNLTHSLGAYLRIEFEAALVSGEHLTYGEVLETVMHIVGCELQSAWQALSLEFKFEHRQLPGQVEQLMPAAERILLLSFELTLL